MTSGVMPFYNISHNAQLIFRICSGERPKIIENTPLNYENLMKLCWNPDPSQRLNGAEIFIIINDWIENFEKNPHEIKSNYVKDAITKFKEHDKLKMTTSNDEADPIYTHHPQSY
ncbi:11209_t:CDS:1, partial [Racocetra persica]